MQVFTRTIPVDKSALIRKVLSFCLVVLMAIQPVSFAIARGVDIGDCTSSAPLKCASCMCCDVGGDQESCGCCIEVNVETCFGDSRTADESRPQEPRLDSAVSEVKAVPAVADGKDLPLVTMAEFVEITGCICGLRAEPFVPAPFRIPFKELSETVQAASLIHSVLTVHLNTGNPRSFLIAGTSPFSPHFSQRNLCVWRL